MYDRMAHRYDAIYDWKDYAGEAARLQELIGKYHSASPRTLLDLGCGTARHLEHLVGDFDVCGADLEPRMLEVARARLPHVTFFEADLIDFDLGRSFDVVTCLFSSIGYAPDLEALQSACRSISRHLRPRGIAIIEPWFTPEAFRPDTLHMNTVDRPELKIARMNVSRVEGRLAVMEMHHLVGTVEGIEHVIERHEMFLATDEEVTRALEEAGLEVFREAEGFANRGLYIARAGAHRSDSTP
ncbi:MAG: methyltransferase domain-containing protein [Planctomycetes bacterium]|nr:methyltransferase domain-containing protein [Planctomycetota bacterium]